MIELRRGVRLELETLSDVRVQQLAVRELHRDVDAQAQVARAPDRAHAALAHQLFEAILRPDDLPRVVPEGTGIDGGMF